MALSLGLAEWLRAGGLAATPADAARAVPAIAAAYAGLGLLAVGLAAALRRDGATAIALVVATLLLVEVGEAAERRLMLLAAVALGAAVGWGCQRALTAMPRLAAGIVWLPVAGLLLAVSALAPLRGAPGPTPAGEAPAGAPSVLLVSIDTLRADAVGAYGRESARTPALDALAAEGTRFQDAIAPSIYTGPSHAALLSGLHPSTTGFLVNYGGLGAEFPTLADALGAQGWSTAAFPSAWTTASGATRLPTRFQVHDEELRQYPWLPVEAMKPRLLRPLRRWLQARQTWPPYRPAAPTTDRAVAWLASRAQTPFFAWVHYFDPHVPYQPPAELSPPATGEAADVDGRWYALDRHRQQEVIGSPQRVARMRELYDAEVRYVDREVARLVAAAREAAGEKLWIVVTADHGEAMGEHGIWWNRDLYDATLRVPLIVVPPEGAAYPRGAVVTDTVALLDVAPTLLEALGVAPQHELDGRSLLRLIQGQALPSKPVTSRYVPEEDAFRAPARAVRTERWKLIEREAGWGNPDFWQAPRAELYDLEADPAETRNLMGQHADIALELRENLEPGVEGPAQRELSEAEREQLRALGYLQ